MADYERLGYKNYDDMSREDIHNKLTSIFQEIDCEYDIENKRYFKSNNFLKMHHIPMRRKKCVSKNYKKNLYNANLRLAMRYAKQHGIEVVHTDEYESGLLPVNREFRINELWNTHLPPLQKNIPPLQKNILLISEYDDSENLKKFLDKHFRNE